MPAEYGRNSGDVLKGGLHSRGAGRLLGCFDSLRCGEMFGGKQNSLFLIVANGKTKGLA